MRHFTDARTEELLDGGDAAAAREYLSDMLALAREQGDRARQETYRYYLGPLDSGAGPSVWRHTDYPMVWLPRFRRSLRRCKKGRAGARPLALDLRVS